MSYYFVSSVVLPVQYYTYSTPILVNGSSDTGNCASGNNQGPVTCSDPSSSVLFDDPGGMPILTGLDGDMWASQLLTIQTTTTFVDIIFDFHDTPDFTTVEGVEVVMFNCPQWEIGAQTIQVLEVQDTLTVAPTSCDSLVRVCLSLSSTTPMTSTLYNLRFHSPNSKVHWIHLAEVTFWGNNLTCPPDIVITEPTTAPPSSPVTSTSQESQPTTENTLITLTPNTALTSIPATGSTTSLHNTLTPNTILTSGTTTEPASGTTTEPNSMNTTVIAVVIVLIVLLLLLVGVVVVVLVLWRCRHQHTAKEEASHTSSQTHTPQAPLVSQDTDQDNTSNVYSSLTARSEKKGAKSHTEIQEYSVLHHGEQPFEKKKSQSVNLTVCDPAGRQEEQSQEYSTLYHGEKPVQGASGTGDTSFYDTIDQKYQVKTKGARGKVGVWGRMGSKFDLTPIVHRVTVHVMCVCVCVWGGGGVVQ